jgi:hypothetical protein
MLILITKIVSGTYGDMLVTSLATKILDSFDTNFNSYPFNLMGIIMNVSAYLKNLSKISSQKLLQLLMLFTNYSFLLQSSSNPYCLLKLMRVFDNIISFQNASNTTLILEMWKRQQHFARVTKLNFSERTIEFFCNEIEHKS